ncbi:hypothetical protein [Streptomyces sp. NEAU-W12]|uniref:hypothetical protein n=1 Tax=Streptomyces sp. NEAU-W12 TaxID=2994668 RepID=UPI00224B33A9|nr:hypothetical protein [Streptomyces sp. NEAU-W12]
MIVPDGGTTHGVRVAFDRTGRAEPAGARRFVFLFDASLRFRPEAFPTCSRTTIEQRGVHACPQGSQVGRGTSHLYPDGTAEVRAFDTRHPGGARGAPVVVPASGTILELAWERVTPPYRRAGHRWALDEILPPTTTPPGRALGGGAGSGAHPLEPSRKRAAERMARQQS